MIITMEEKTMIDVNKIVQGLSSSGAVSGFAGGLAGTALAGAMSGKKGRKVAKSALKVGALAAVGGLAYTAYQRYRQGGDQSAAEPATAKLAASSTAATPSQWENIERDRFEAALGDGDTAAGGSLLLLRAMIAAAAADGHMDSSEQQRIFAEADRMDLSPQEKAALFDELREPLRMQQLVAQVKNPETAIEVYAASLVAVDETRTEGRAYLRGLAAALDLPEALVESVHKQVEAATREEAA